MELFSLLFLFLFLHFFHSRRERRTRVFVRTLSITFLITRFLRRDRGTRLTRACIACASSVSVRFREKKNGRRVSLLSRKKKDRRADFLRTERGIIVRSRSPGKKKRERDPPRVNSPPLEKAPREREEEERIALVDTQKTTLKNTSGGEE